MNQPICRWGILGAAQIARKNWQAIRHASNCDLVAVASRDPARCQQFIDQCQEQVPFKAPPRACAGYDELLAIDEIDAVYIPLPTGVRKAWAIRAAEAGKHVLLEKPVGVTTADVREIVDACRRNHVQVMDGVMFMHSRRLASIRKALDDGESIGRVKRITSAFTFGAPKEFFDGNIRTHSDLEPLGCLGDLGWYSIRFVLWVMNWQLPGKVVGHMLAEHSRSDSPFAVPTDFSAELFFKEGASASIYCSFLTGIQQWANISGTLGQLHMRDFVLPYYGSELGYDISNPEFHVDGCDFNMEDHTRRFAVREYSNREASAQETTMFHHFADLALSGQPDFAWGEFALKTQQVLDACLESARSQGQAVALDA